MIFLYNLGIQCYYLLIKIAQHFNTKAHLWIEGRENILEKISKVVDSKRQSIWFHFASLGEFEQGRPVLERINESYPTHQIIVTFFSPSGYELRKNYTRANHIFYLPLDTNANAKRFVEIINPTLAIFTKYEFWYHYYYQLHQKNIPLVVISAIFRPSQAYFRWYGKWNRKILGFVDHFFVQDDKSKRLLNDICIKQVTVSGDTRFDRVVENAESPKELRVIKQFCKGANIFVGGSTWPEDEKLIAKLIYAYPEWRFILAPHEIKEEKISKLAGLLNDKSIRYSEIKDGAVFNSQVLIIDNIGMLSSLYQYADVAYIGGGFGVGIHNTLEAAAFGVPVLFGPNYHKFREAVALIERGAAFSVSEFPELASVMKSLESEEERKERGSLAREYVYQEQGATELIMVGVKKFIEK